MGLEEARGILEEAKTLHAEDRCASSIRKSQEAVKAALKGLLKALGVEPTGALSDHLSKIPDELQRTLREACGESVWIALACEAKLERSVAGPKEGSCTKLDSEAALRSAERIINLVEEALRS